MSATNKNSFENIKNKILPSFPILGDREGELRKILFFSFSGSNFA